LNGSKRKDYNDDGGILILSNEFERPMSCGKPFTPSSPRSLPFTGEIIVCGITQNEIFCSLIGSEMVKLNVFEMPDESKE